MLILCSDLYGKITFLDIKRTTYSFQSSCCFHAPQKTVMRSSAWPVLFFWGGCSRIRDRYLNLGLSVVSRQRVDAVRRDICVTGDIYQEQELVMDDELSGESEQILGHRLKQSRDQNHSQVMSGHLVHPREHLDSEEETSHSTVSDALKLILSVTIFIIISRHHSIFLKKWPSSLLHVEVSKQGF